MPKCIVWEGVLLLFMRKTYHQLSILGLMKIHVRGIILEKRKIHVRTVLYKVSAHLFQFMKS